MKDQIIAELEKLVALKNQTIQELERQIQLLKASPVNPLFFAPPLFPQNPQPWVNPLNPLGPTYITISDGTMQGNIPTGLEAHGIDAKNIFIQNAGNTI